MPRIEIGAGLVLAALAPFGLLGNIPTAVVIAVVGVLLIVHGSYEEWIKPRFRVDKRIADWLIRRGWFVRIEELSQFNFALHIVSSSSGVRVRVSRDKKARDDLLSFTSLVMIDRPWVPTLNAMTLKRRQEIIEEIKIYVTSKNLAYVLGDPLNPQSGIYWPPVPRVQTALAQDQALSQHSVDMAAKAVEATALGVRAIIRKAVIQERGDDVLTLTLTRSPGSGHDMGESPPQ